MQTKNELADDGYLHQTAHVIEKNRKKQNGEVFALAQAKRNILIERRQQLYKKLELGQELELAVFWLQLEE